MSDLVGDARHLSPSAQEALRLRAVAALAAGRDREDVAALFGVSLKAVDNWWAKWQAGGREALAMRPRGKPVGVHQVLGEAGRAAIRQAVPDELHFLPPYSPGLNPDELVNAGLEHGLPKRHRARGQAELAAEPRRFLRRRQRQPHIVRGYFGGTHVRYVLDETP
ncbi:helix-turn-helix domain-containing protein [Streptomyces sp. NPDC014986]|uniref:helix-turn-helix domain-containing protein n=1 Tax=Streptomyces sp. NPDC014986 TaxID=3364934 RepID=UPI0036F8D035